MRYSAIVAALIGLGSWAAARQDRPPTLGKVLSNTSRLKSYSFKISGGAESISGIYEKPGLYYSAGGVEAAGRGGIRLGRVGDKWASISSLIQAGHGGESLKRLAQLQPPHILARAITAYVQRFEGDGFSGFRGELVPGNLRQLVQEPWIDDRELREAGGLRGSVSIDCTEGRISRITISVSGRKVEWKRRAYHGRLRKGDPPPTPPAPNWKYNPNDGYWYEGKEKSVDVRVEIEIREADTARIPDDVRKKIGMR